MKHSLAIPFVLTFSVATVFAHLPTPNPLLPSFPLSFGSAISLPHPFPLPVPSISPFPLLPPPVPFLSPPPMLFPPHFLSLPAPPQPLQPTVSPSLPAICTMPLVQGPCEGRQIKYGYSISIRKCSSFVYSGCQGNENNFATLEECLKMCP